MPAAWQHVKAGQASRRSRVTSAKRSLTAPDVPTICERGGAGLRRSSSWYGALAPAQDAARDRREVERRVRQGAARTPQVKEKLFAQGAEARRRLTGRVRTA